MDVLEKGNTYNTQFDELGLGFCATFIKGSLSVGIWIDRQIFVGVEDGESDGYLMDFLKRCTHVSHPEDMAVGYGLLLEHGWSGKSGYFEITTTLKEYHRKVTYMLQKLNGECERVESREERKEKGLRSTCRLVTSGGKEIDKSTEMETINSLSEMLRAAESLLKQYA